jgi:hypothetical protein
MLGPLLGHYNSVKKAGKYHCLHFTGEEIETHESCKVSHMACKWQQDLDSRFYSPSFRASPYAFLIFLMGWEE